MDAIFVLQSPLVSHTSQRFCSSNRCVRGQEHARPWLLLSLNRVGCSSTAVHTHKMHTYRKPDALFCGSYVLFVARHLRMHLWGTRFCKNRPPEMAAASVSETGHQRPTVEPKSRPSRVRDARQSLMTPSSLPVARIVLSGEKARAWTRAPCGPFSIRAPGR